MKSFDPSSRPLARWQMHFDGVLMPEQVLGMGAVEPFNDSLISMNFSAPTSNRETLAKSKRISSNK